MAGKLEFNDYFDYSDEVYRMNLKIARDIYKTKDPLELKYIEMGWKSQIVEDQNSEPIALGP